MDSLPTEPRLRSCFISSTPNGKASTVAHGVILGREQELAAIARYVDGDRSRPGAFLIEGEAGIGKTTLWQEGLHRARRTSRVLASRVSQVETKLSYTVLGDLLATSIDEAFAALPARQRSALEAALLLGPPARLRPDTRAVSHAVLATLRSLAAEGHVTIAIDDVQWIDTPSARALSFALRRLEEGSVSVLAAKRVAPGLVDPLDLARLPSGLERLPVGPMSVVPLGHLLRDRLGHLLGSPLAKRIHEASGGNPFFAVEIGRALGAQDVIPRPGEPLPIPPDLEGLLLDRMSSLSDPARRVLLIAAASAQPTSELIDRAGGEPSGLDEAEGAGIVECRGVHVRFTHPLLASAVYTGASWRARRDTHALLAEIATDPEERARHLALAIDGPDQDAADALERAARHAEGRGAPTAAAELYQLAVSVTPPALVDQLRGRRHGALGNLWAAGDIAGARDLNQLLLGELEPGPGRAHTLYIMASVSWDDVSQVVSFLRRALDEVGDDSLTRAYILAELAWAALSACDPAASVTWAAEALDVAEVLDEPGPLRTTLCVRAMAESMLGQDGDALIERALHLEGPPEYNDLSTPRICRGRLQTWAGELDPARETLETELARRLEFGHETSTWEVRACLAEVEYRAGRWRLAAEHAQEAREILEDAGWYGVLGEVLSTTAAIAGAMGETERARSIGVETVRECDRLGDRWTEMRARSALGFLELSLGDHAACHGWLEPLIGLNEGMGLREPGVFPFVPDEVEALVQLGEVGTAQHLTDLLEDQGRARNRPLALATAARCRGLIAGERRDLDEASEHLTRALERHSFVPQPFERARTLLAAGSVRRRMRHAKLARELLHGALDVFEELGAPLWAAKATAELARIGGRAPAPDALTPTEEQVASLVAEGRTNREVAEALFMSVHTVDAHLRRIYRKLQVRSRTELSRKL
jgi:DNA-binding CsgD family transcriptional regulator